LIVSTVSETQQKQTKSILPAQLTEQENFTPIAERATGNQRLDKRATRLFTVNSNMHFKRLIAIKVLLHCRLASCNCSIELSKRHITKLHTKNGVRSTAQISGLFGQQKHSNLVRRIWLLEGRNITKVHAVLLSSLARQNRKTTFFVTTVRDCKADEGLSQHPVRRH